MTEDAALDVAVLSDTGTTRDHNEDACGAVRERRDCAIAAVADGVSSGAAGEVASQMAIEVLLREFRDQGADVPAGQRLYRAVQQANIEIYDRAVAVPELRGMATTLTAAVVEDGALTAVHVGDSRLYLLRGGVLTQLSKDHTIAAERARFGLMSKERARTHVDRCVLTRSVGRELIVSRDRITQPLAAGDVLLLCSDGLHGVLDEAELARLLAAGSADAACRALVDVANARGTPDNLSAAVVRVLDVPAERAAAGGLGAAMRRILGRPG
ncbi:MAG TPA: protein phosphatase 2C domain-containing protein [Anaeromyxobacteraceae bacterium]